MTTRADRYDFACAVVLAGLVVTLGAAEIALRLLPRPERKAHSVSDRVRHHRLRADWRGIVQGFPYRTNALGLRDRDLAQPKPAGTVRVLMLGDSFTEGGGFPDADTVPRRVETALRTPCPGVEVVNAGIASYSPILEYLLLQEVGAAVAPDLVVVNLDMTDVHDDLIRTALAALDGGSPSERAVAYNWRYDANVSPGRERALRALHLCERFARLHRRPVESMCDPEEQACAMERALFVHRSHRSPEERLALRGDAVLRFAILVALREEELAHEMWHVVEREQIVLVHPLEHGEFVVRLVDDFAALLALVLMPTARLPPRDVVRAFIVRRPGAPPPRHAGSRSRRHPRPPRW
jgi:hypothetical protein